MKTNIDFNRSQKKFIQVYQVKYGRDTKLMRLFKSLETINLRSKSVIMIEQDIHSGMI